MSETSVHRDDDGRLNASYLADMSLRPPQTRPATKRDGVLDYEIAQEQAAALGRLGRALEAALDALARYDSAEAERRQAAAALTSAANPLRTRLVQDASHALWCFIIQREVCGLRDQRQVVRDFGVPGEVHNRMGAFGGDRRP
jgi:hypothetical protein